MARLHPSADEHAARGAADVDARPAPVAAAEVSAHLDARLVPAGDGDAGAGVEVEVEASSPGEAATVSLIADVSGSVADSSLAAASTPAAPPASASAKPAVATDGLVAPAATDGGRGGRPTPLDRRAGSAPAMRIALGISEPRATGVRPAKGTSARRSAAATARRARGEVTRRGRVSSSTASRRPSSVDGRAMPIATAPPSRSPCAARATSSSCAAYSARRRAGREHAVVAGALGFAAQAAQRHPRQRMEPVDRAGGLAEQLREVVAAARRAPARASSAARRRSSGHDSASIGIKRTGCRTPQVTGVVTASLVRNVTGRATPGFVIVAVSSVCHASPSSGSAERTRRRRPR